MDAIAKNLYFKFSANNVTLSILGDFLLKKIESNIKADALFFLSSIKEASSVKKINAADSDRCIFVTTIFITKGRKDCQF